MKKSMVIIGAGLAGYMLAKNWRKLDTDSELTIITEDDGHFYSKPLLSTALTQKKTAGSLPVSTVDQMRVQLDARIMTSCSALSIDKGKKVAVTSQGEVSYDQLVLACGAYTINPPLTGDAVDDVISVNNLLDYAEFQAWLENKKHIGILGAGLVGCEFCNDLINTGHHVSMIAPEDQPLASLLPGVLGEMLRQALSDQGVDWHLGRLAKTVDGNYRIGLDNGDSCEVDGVLSAIGLRPNIALAEAAGLSVGVGIQVNAQLQTSDENIYALGDCAEVMGHIKQYVAPLLHGAQVLAKVLHGDAAAVQYPPMPVVIKTPALPVVSLPPSLGVMGEWHIEGDKPHLKALYYDDQQQLRGFALVGDSVREKMKLAKSIVI